mgnify:FL=1
MGDPVTTTAAVVAGSGAAKGMIDSNNSKKSYSNARHTAENERADLANRQEATYRDQRAMLNSAIDAYYDKQGWSRPTTQAPGAYTLRRLPGEQELYPYENKDRGGYEMPNRPQAQTPEQAAQGDSGVQAQTQAQQIVGAAPAIQTVQPQVVVDPNAQQQAIDEKYNHVLAPLYLGGSTAKRIVPL